MTVVTTSRPILVVLGILGVLATGSAGCASGARVGMGPVLRIPEAPPRVVTTLPVSAPEPAPAEAEPTTTERTDATAGAAEDKPPRSVRRPPPAEDSAEVASDAVQVQRELTSAPDEDTDRRGAGAIRHGSEVSGPGGGGSRGGQPGIRTVAWAEGPSTGARALALVWGVPLQVLPIGGKAGHDAHGLERVSGVACPD